MIGRDRARRRSVPAIGYVCLAVLTAALMSACGSSGAPAPASSSLNHSSGTTPSASAGASAAPGTPADAATTAAVKAAYTKLFAPDTPLAESVKSLQNGTAFKKALVEQGKSPLAKSSSASVRDVRLVSAATARVTFSILLAGKPVLADQTGYAVREDGVWKVADVTFCGLLTMQGGAPAACSTPAATTTPS